MAAKQLKNECIYHKQLITRLWDNHDYQQITTNKLNRILHQMGKLSSKYLIQRIIEKSDGANALKYKVIPAEYSDRSKPNNKIN